MLKIKFGLLKLDTINKYMRKNYCRFGIHRLKPSYVRYGGTGQRMKHINFLECNHCNYLFFAKPSDKKRYEEYNKKD